VLTARKSYIPRAIRSLEAKGLDFLDVGYTVDGSGILLFLETVNNDLWIPSWNDRPFFSIVASAHDDTGMVDYYIMETLESSNLPTRMPFLMDSISPVHRLNTIGSPSLNLCDRYVVQAWCEG